MYFSTEWPKHKLFRMLNMLKPIHSVLTVKQVYDILVILHKDKELSILVREAQAEINLITTFKQ